MFKYVTKGTFDAYNWSLVENKQKFIGQIMTGKSPARSVEDVDATALSYAEIKALATGDGRIREKMELDVAVTKLKTLKANHTAQQYELQDNALKYYPRKIAETKLYIEAWEKDLPLLQANQAKDGAFSMTVLGRNYTERKAAGNAIFDACSLTKDPDVPVDLGEYRGFPMQLRYQNAKFYVTLKGALTYEAELSNDHVGSIMKINNALEEIPKALAEGRVRLALLEDARKSAWEGSKEPFPKEAELREKQARLTQLNLELESTDRNPVRAGEEPEEKSLSDGAERASEDSGAPAPEPSAPKQKDGKSSILQALRGSRPPAPEPPGPDKDLNKEAAL